MTKMARYVLICIALNKCFQIVPAQAIEENNPVNLTCSLPSDVNVNLVSYIRWFLPSTTNTVNLSAPFVSECTLQNLQCNNIFGSGIAAIVAVNSNGYTTSILSITNASRTLYPALFGNAQNIYWNCAWLTDTKTLVYKSNSIVYLYVKPQPLMCDFKVLNQTSVTGSCTAERVYPMYYCIGFTSKDNVSLRSYTEFTSSSNIARNESPEFYRFWCNITWTVFYPGSTNFLKVSVNTNGFSLYSDVFTFTPVFSEFLSTQIPITSTVLSTKLPTLSTNPSTKLPTISSEASRNTTNAVDISQASSQGLVIGLAVATGLCAAAATLLAVSWLVCSKLRFKQSKKTEGMSSEAPIFLNGQNKTVIPTGYNQPIDIKLTDEAQETVYEIVERTNNSSLPALHPITNPVGGRGHNGPYANIRDPEKQKSEVFEEIYEN